MEDFIFFKTSFRASICAPRLMNSGALNLMIGQVSHDSKGFVLMRVEHAIDQRVVCE